MAKYGFASFIVDVLAIPNTVDELDNLEKLWIILLNSQNSELGYNVCFGGRGNGRLGMAHSEETKIKLSISHIGQIPQVYVRTKEHCRKCRERVLNETPECREKRVTGIRNFWNNCTSEQREEHRIKVREGCRHRINVCHMTKEQRIERARKAIQTRWERCKLLKKEGLC